MGRLSAPGGVRENRRAILALSITCRRKELNDRCVNDSRVYLVGGGIASLAAATFLIRDAGISGKRITVIEASNSLGGSLDAAGSAEAGYVMRGGRMFESKYVCTFDLFSSIPTLDGSKSVTEEILDWNTTLQTNSKSRLFRNGHREEAPEFGLSEKQITKLEWFGIVSEVRLGRTTIEDHFDSSFFESGFWLMWSTTFAFQPWHSAVEFKRYLLRFVHMIKGFSQLKGILRTKYNQYDSLVRPLQRWLREAGVRFEVHTRVTDLSFLHDAAGYSVETILYERRGEPGQIRVNKQDFVFVTLGSMTESSSIGSMDSPAPLCTEPKNGSWALWKKLAFDRPQFGNPDNFSNHVAQSKWLSFTATLQDSIFLEAVKELTGNVPGEGGLITFPDSNWLMSIVLPHQPHFIGQLPGLQVFWGYGLFVDKPGNFVTKPMSACTGRELMTEVLGHLGLTHDAGPGLDQCNCIPCMMPYITSQFLSRSAGDRPQVVPSRSKNLALIGQFCELPDDVVFTVEYSVRSAQTAVYKLLGLDRLPPPVYQGKINPLILVEALATLHDAAGRHTNVPNGMCP